MELKTSNWNKPSNKKWKLLADVMLYSLIGQLPILAALPIDETLKIWIGFGLAELILIFKVISKFTQDEYEQNS